MKEHKVALVVPGKRSEFGISPPFNIGYLAGYLLKHGVEVHIVDQLAGQDVRKRIEEIKPSIVGLTATTPLVKDAYEIADWVKKNTNALTVMGGVHASVMPDEALEHVDVVVKGEGEKALLDIVLNGPKSKVATMPAFKDIDEVPSPEWKLLDIDFYLSTRDRLPGTHLAFAPPGSKVATLITSRGCPYSCTFCYNSWRETAVRFHSAQRVIDEIKDLRENYGADVFFFTDDDFLVQRRRLKEFCDLIIKEGLQNTPWACQTRVDTITEENLSMIKEAGCRQVGFGFESGSQRILNILKNETTTVEENAKAIRLCKKHGLLVFGTFMIGNPTETWEDLEATKRFILEKNIDYLGIFITTPFPGTKLWSWCKEKNLIPENFDWSDFTTGETSPSACDTIPREKLVHFYQELTLKIKMKTYSTLPKLIAQSFKHPVRTLSLALKHPKVITERIFNTGPWL